MGIENENVDQDFLGMSDEEVMGMMPPAPAATTETPAGEGEPAGSAEGEVDTAGQEGGAPAGDEGEPDPAAAGEGEDGGEADPATADEQGKTKAPVTKTPEELAATAGKTPAKDGEGKAKPGEKTPEEKAAEAAPVTIDYEAGYKKIMAPFKANGREIQLQSPEEAVKLMQMGANYTKKMQALQPALRVVKMLENNQLLDEGQLSYLIDLHQRKPEAIQKLLADSKFDPLKADEEQAAAYVPGNHRVSDGEIQFQQALDEIEATPTGAELITEVAQQWDADSKQALFKDPRLLTVINGHKANGLYDQIHAELSRRRVLGQFQGVPFLAAYEAVGAEMQTAGLLGKPAEEVAPRQEAVVTRVVPPTSKVANTERAKAAMPTRATPSSAREEVNPLAQSDDEFLKQMQGRV
jgi:hypothetical protein